MAHPPTSALVLFAHGARDAAWALPLRRLQARLAARMPGERVECAFLERLAPALPETLDALAAAGIARIRIAPIFWATGAHTGEDLPRLVDQFRGRSPEVHVQVLPVLSDLPGIDDFLCHSFGAPAAPFSAARYLREIGRGKDGARGLAREDARELMGAILDRRVDAASVGAVLLALRMKGESVDEVAGFLEAAHARMDRLPARSPGWVVVPSYNGARSTVNLVPLLALLLAREGLPVLVHGQQTEPDIVTRRRVTTAAILACMGVGACADAQAASMQVDRGLPVYMELGSLAPALSALLDLRRTLGVRNVGHTLAKLVRPVQGASLLVTSYTHPEFGRLHAELFTLTGEHAMNLRGTDGESVVGARRVVEVDLWRDGRRRAVVEADSVVAVDLALPGTGAQDTAQWTAEVLAGHKPAPPGLLAQVAAIRAGLGAAA